MTHACILSMLKTCDIEAEGTLRAQDQLGPKSKVEGDLGNLSRSHFKLKKSKKQG